MLNAFLIGLLATSSLIIGGLIATRLTLARRILGIIMAFGAGTLISAVSYELVYEAVKLAKGTGFPAFGLFAGAFTFYFCDKLIGKLGARNRMAISGSHHSSLWCGPAGWGAVAGELLPRRTRATSAPGLEARQDESRCLRVLQQGRCRAARSAPRPTRRTGR